MRRASAKRTTAASGPGRVAFVLEQTLGHVTHSENLRSLLADDDRIHPTFLPIPFETTGRWARLPLWSNWTIRAGVRAGRAIARQRRHVGIDAMFVHTQVPAVLNRRWVRRIPTIVSLDATPLQYDRLGEHYAHGTSTPSVESVKHRLNRACYRRARGLVVWSEWTRRSLVDEYQIDPARIEVVPPGVDLARWRRPDPAPERPPVVRVLFVGGDLDRKGGRTLLEAAATLRVDPSVPRFELVLVTRSPVDEQPGVEVHSSMAPNSRDLVDLYHGAHIFCLPTFGDCLPMVLSEAGAAELALVATDVGAIGEIVQPGTTGVLVRPGDAVQLAHALRVLIVDGALRRRLGRGAAAHVAAGYDARVNAERLVTLLLEAHA